MLLIALTGGIGAGKSTVARALVEHGAALLDADALAREVVDPANPTGRSVLATIAAALGPSTLTAAGELDRAAVAEIVFGDPALLARYNAIIHPVMLNETASAIQRHRESGTAVVVHEIPLLNSESGPLPWTYDLIVTVEANAAERIQRLVSIRGYTEEHARARIVAQGAEDGRTSIANVVIRTDGSLAATHEAVDALWRRLTCPPVEAPCLGREPTVDRGLSGTPWALGDSAP